MKKTMFALLVCFLLVFGAAASAGVYGNFVSEDDETRVFILKEPVNDSLSGAYLGNDNFLLSLLRQDDENGSTRLYTPLDVSDSIIELLFTYEDDSMQAALVSGYIKRFDDSGALVEDQSVPEMQNVRFVRQEVPPVSQLRGTRWFRYSMTISGTSRDYPFDGSVIEFFDTGGQYGPDSR